jgi:hypothetical protein
VNASCFTPVIHLPLTVPSRIGGSIRFRPKNTIQMVTGALREGRVRLSVAAVPDWFAADFAQPRRHSQQAAREPSLNAPTFGARLPGYGILFLAVGHHYGSAESTAYLPDLAVRRFVSRGLRSNLFQRRSPKKKSIVPLHCAQKMNGR